MGERGVEEAPLLVVEILSPSTRRRDLIRKFTWFRDFGIPHVWFADPDEPSVIAHDLVGQHYVESGHAVGTERLVLERPFAIDLAPADLLDG